MHFSLVCHRNASREIDTQNCGTAETSAPALLKQDLYVTLMWTIRGHAVAIAAAQLWLLPKTELDQ